MCEVSSFQLEDASEFAPEGAILLNIASRSSRPSRHVGDYLEAKLRVFAHQGRRTLPWRRSVHRTPDLGGCARHIPSGRAASETTACGYLCWDERAADRRKTSCACAARTTARTRAAAAAIALARGLDIDAVPRGCARSPASSIASRRSRARRRALRQRLQGDERRLDTRRAGKLRRAPVHLILGGVGKGQDFTALLGRAQRAYLIGGRRRARRAIVGRRALRRRSKLAVARRARRPARAKSSCCRRHARLSISSPTSKRAGGRSRSSSRSRPGAATACATQIQRLGPKLGRMATAPHHGETRLAWIASQRVARASLVASSAVIVCWALYQPRTADLAAQVYRSGLFERVGWVLWDNGWFGGHTVPGYSLLTPVADGERGHRRDGCDRRDRDHAGVRGDRAAPEPGSTDDRG